MKICGITRVGDAQAAAAAGADALGFVFYPRSPRCITAESARDIARSVPPFVTVTALFVDALDEEIARVLDVLPVDLLQFHGNETNAACRSWGRPFIKAIAMRPGTDAMTRMQDYPDAAGFLLDAWQPDTHGGGGKAFDWREMPAAAGKPLILAGGLAPGNVADAIRQTRPYAVDVSSGVEDSPGIKSADRINAFMKGVTESGA